MSITNTDLPRLRAELVAVEREVDRADDTGDTGATARIRRTLRLLRMRVADAERATTGVHDEPC